VFAGVLRIHDVYFGSRIQGQKDSRSRIRIRIKEFKYFQPNKLFLSSRKYNPRCSSQIPDPDPQHWFAENNIS
jgi:hypothetical protein